MSEILKPHSEIHASAIAYLCGSQLVLRKRNYPNQNLWVIETSTEFNSQAERDKAYKMIIQHKENSMKPPKSLRIDPDGVYFICPECRELRPDDERVKADLKCFFCTYGTQSADWQTLSYPTKPKYNK